MSSDTAKHHAAVTAAAGERLQKIARARDPRKRQALNVSDIAAGVRLIQQGLEWREVKERMADIADHVLETWRPELEKRAALGEQRRMP